VKAPVRIERSRDDGRTWRCVKRVSTIREAAEWLDDHLGRFVSPASLLKGWRDDRFEEGEQGAGDGWLRVVDEREHGNG